MEGHFLGNHSVLDILRQEGYEVVHTPSHPQQPITEGVPDRADPTVNPSDESLEAGTVFSPSGWVTSPVELEDQGEEGEEPHMLLPDSLSQLEEFGRNKRPRKAHRGPGQPRLFSDLWVRIGDSSSPQPSVRIINGYVTVEPPLTHQEQRRRTALYPPAQPSTPASTTALPSSASPSPSPSLTLPCLLLAWLVSHKLFTS
ncbi:metalloprotease TIKI2-like [Osmerus eperlanus]|uniref:metalloprotease TIKI2-like n=1 Tax=Osmerus eperlanus TaxID=29151 RepID=UPI002E0D1B84